MMRPRYMHRPRHVGRLPVIATGLSLQTPGIAATARARTHSRPRVHPWGLVPRYAQALPPHVLQHVLANTPAVVHGVLRRPAWEGSADKAASLSFTDAFATPRDAYAMDVCMRVVMGYQEDTSSSAAAASAGAKAGEEAARALFSRIESQAVAATFTSDAAAPSGVRRGRRNRASRVSTAGSLEDPEQEPRAGSPLPSVARDTHLLDTRAVAAFLDGAKTLFMEMFQRGVPDMTKLSAEDAAALKELVHPALLERWRDAHTHTHTHTATQTSAPTATQDGSNAAALGPHVKEIVSARIVDAFSVWDGTSRAGDVAADQVIARRMGNSISLASLPRPGELIMTLAKQFLHFFQLLPARTVISQVTVAFLCKETGVPTHTGTEPQHATSPAPTIERSADSTAEAFFNHALSASPSLTAFVPLPENKWLMSGRSVSQTAEDAPWLEVVNVAGMRRDAPREPPASAFAAVAVPPPSAETAAATQPSAAQADGERLTVHTVTLEAAVEVASESWFSLLKFVLPTALRTSQAWKIVDVDGHMCEGASVPISFHKLWYKAHELAEQRARAEIAEVMDEIREMRTFVSAVGATLRSDCLPALGELYGAVEQVEEATPAAERDPNVIAALAHLMALFADAEAACSALEAASSYPPWLRRLDVERNCMNPHPHLTTPKTLLDRVAQARLLVAPGGSYKGSPVTTLAAGAYLIDSYADIHALRSHLSFFAKAFGLRVFGLDMFLSGRNRFLVGNNPALNMRVELEVILQAVTAIAVDAVCFAGLSVLRTARPGPELHRLALELHRASKLSGSSLGVSKNGAFIKQAIDSVDRLLSAARTDGDPTGADSHDGRASDEDAHVGDTEDPAVAASIAQRTGPLGAAAQLARLFATVPR